MVIDHEREKATITHKFACLFELTAQRLIWSNSDSWEPVIKQKLWT